MSGHMTVPAETSRKTFFNISSFQALAMFRRGLFYSYLSIYLRFFLGLSVTETTFFASFPMVLNVLFQTFVWGVVSDKYQKRRTLIILGEVSAAIITVIVWFVHTMPASKYVAGYVIIIGLSVVEIFWSMSNVAWTALISDLYPEYRRTAVQGQLTSIGAAGRIIGVWIGGLAYDGLARYYEGWGFDKGLLFFVASGVMLLSTIPMFYVPEGGACVPEEGKAVGGEIPGRQARQAAYSRKFVMFLIALMLINFGRNSVAVTRSQYLVLDEGFNVSSRLLSYIVNMQSVAGVIVGILVGRLSRRYADSLLLQFGSVIAAVSLLGYAVAQVLTPIFASEFLAGAGHVIIIAASYTYASRLIPPERRGRQFALYNATLFLSWGVAGTLVAGPIVDYLIRTGATQAFAYKMSFVAGAILVGIGMLVFGLVNKMEDQPEVDAHGRGGDESPDSW
jgi:MFS family permease